MDTMRAFAMGQASRHKEPMVFDWLKAARIIAERNPRLATAGLYVDWEWTGGAIWRDGLPVPRAETDVFLASTWATPQLNIDGEEIECFVMRSETPGWDAETYWPDEALAIIGRKFGERAA